MDTKSRSYRVRKDIPEGSQAVILDASTPLTEDYIDQTVRILTYSNAGFDGIVAWVQANDGTRFHISAGHLAKPD